jgi:bacterioferritin
MEHLHILGTLLLKLGIDPVFAYPYRYNYYKADSLNYSTTPQKILMDSITGELLAIEGYENILKTLKNEDVAAVISRIKLDEELHVKVLRERLDILIKNRNNR